MSKQIEALKLALECIEAWDRGCDRDHYWRDIEAAITAIKEALAEQPAQQQSAERWEPVAYAVYHRMGGSKSLHWPEQHSEDGDHNEYRLVPLYTAPQQRQWVGLTKKEVYDLYESDYAVFYQRIEAKLKEKNT